MITLPAGPYFGTQTDDVITDSDTAGGAVIRYTTDGSTPTAASRAASARSPLPLTKASKRSPSGAGTRTSAVATLGLRSHFPGLDRTTWKTFAVPQKTGTFTWNFSVLAPAAGSDCVVGIGPALISAYTGLACIVQFPGNTINGINGAAIPPGRPIPLALYYNFVAIINTTAHT